jgi:uncharacterized protein YukE
MQSHQREGGYLAHDLYKRSIAMDQAIAHPQDLRDFAEHLRNLSQQLRDCMADSQARFQRLGETWRDVEQEKFSHEFDQAMQVIQRFTELADEHAPFLVRKAERIEEYLQQR